tara:strand:+ start:143 stop:682 length:540 start_codon:yes stop_codon:yes gene_type:complete
VKKTIKLFNLSDLFIYQRLMKTVLLSGLALCLISCGDKVLDTKKSDSGSNNDFILTLTISDDIVYLNSSIKVTAVVERKVHYDSLDSYVTMKIMMDAVGGKIDGQNFTSVSSTSNTPASITVSMDKEVGSQFEALAFFLPTYSYSSTKKEYSGYMQKGQVSASFDNINVTIPVNMVEPR